LIASAAIHGIDLASGIVLMKSSQQQDRGCQNLQLDGLSYALPGHSLIFDFIA